MFKKKILFLFIILLTIQTCNAYTIEGNSVFLEDSTASLTVTPHTARSPVNDFEQTFTLCNKTDTGKIVYSAYIFDKQLEKGKVEYWQKPVYDWIEYELLCDSDFNYVLNEDTDQNPHRAWCFETIDQNGTDANVVLWEQEFKAGSIETATIQYDLNELIFGNNWLDVTTSYQTNSRQLNNKYIYPNVTGTIFLPNSCKTWKINYSPNQNTTNKKWDLWLWTDLWGWNCILTDTCQKTLKLDPWWDSGWESKYPINSMVVSADQNATNWIKLKAIDFSTINSACSEAEDITIVNENTQTEVTDLNFQGWDGTNTDTDVNVLFKLTGTLVADTYNGEYYIYTNNGDCPLKTNDTNMQSAFDDFEDGDYTVAPAYSVWTSGAGGTSTVQSVVKKEGTYALEVVTSTGSTGKLHPLITNNFPFTVGTWFRTSNVAVNSEFRLVDGTATLGEYLCKFQISGTDIYAYGASAVKVIDTPVNLTWYKLLINYDGTNCGFKVFDADEVLLATNTQGVYAGASSPARIFFLNQLSQSAFWDNITFDTATEVTYEIGSEEISSSCSCPESGNWQIINADTCTLATVCNLAGSLHIVSGSLNITSTGTLTIPTGQKITIQKDNNISIQNGGKITITK